MKDKLNMNFIGDGGVSDAVRLRLPAEKLIERGILEGQFTDLSTFMDRKLRVKLDEVWESGDEWYTKSKASVLTRPSLPELLGGLRDKHGHTLICDVDDDFHAIPEHHPGYRAVGPGNLDFLERHSVAMRMADIVTTTTDELANRITQKPINVKPEKIRVIPNGWDDSMWWNMRVPTSTVNIGWGGTITHRADFLLCRDALIEIALKYKDVRVVIAGDPEIYAMMKRIPEKQKMFLPMVRYEDYPHTLTYYDILLAPLENTNFNNGKSDIKLVDAGAAEIPFVASDVPIYSTGIWDEGGYLVRTKDEWFSALEELVLYDEIRERKGKKCREIAMPRHMNTLSDEWLAVYQEAL